MPSPSEASCRACGAPARQLWKAPLLDLNVQYWECPTCGYVQTEEPYWLERAYANAINVSDTGILVRNLANARIVLGTLLLMRSLTGGVVDFAGGMGILTRLLRDYGVEAFWSDSYSQNMLARGFEYAAQPAVLVTAFEAFEHFVNPRVELDKMLAIAPAVLFSTEIVTDPVPPPGKWWYYGSDHGQHIGFFKLQTLRAIADRRGKTLISDGHGYHLISDGNVNSTLWNALVRLKMLAPIFARRHLKSRTWADHLLLTNAGQSADDNS